MFGRVVVLVAGVEQLPRQRRDGSGQAVALFEHRLRDGRGGKVKTFAQLLSKERQDGRVEFIRVVGRRQRGQFGQARRHLARHVAAAAEPRVVGQLVLLAAPGQRAQPGQRRHRLHCQKQRLQNQWRRRRSHPARLRFDAQRDARMAEGAVGAGRRVEVAEGERRNFPDLGVEGRDDLLEVF